MSGKCCCACVITGHGPPQDLMITPPWHVIFDLISSVSFPNPVTTNVIPPKILTGGCDAMERGTPIQQTSHESRMSPKGSTTKYHTKRHHLRRKHLPFPGVQERGNATSALSVTLFSAAYPPFLQKYAHLCYDKEPSASRRILEKGTLLPQGILMEVFFERNSSRCTKTRQ